MPRPGFHQPSSSADNYRVGRRIRAPEVRVIGGDGAQVGILPTYEALKLAEEQGLELVEVNPRAAPPVCRIMDFGKFKYENSKKEKASRKHQSTVVVKEVKFRPKTDDHDLDFKVKHIRRFLAEGNKCRLVIVFRGREIVHPETGQAMLDQVVKLLGDAAVVEQRAAMEGRRMVLTIGPRVGVVRPNPTGVAPAVGGAPPPRPAAPPVGPGPTAAPRPPAPAGATAPGAGPRPPTSSGPGPSGPVQPRPAAPSGPGGAPPNRPPGVGQGSSSGPARPAAAPVTARPAPQGPVNAPKPKA